MSEPSSITDSIYRGSFPLFLNQNKRYFIHIVGVSLLLLLLLPFYKTFIVALIFYAGIRETRRVVRKLPRIKKWFFRILFVSVSFGFVYLISWLINKIANSSLIFSKSGTRKALLERAEQAFNSNIEIVEKWIVGIFPSLNRSEVHDQFVQWLQALFETSFNWIVNWFSELPMFMLQFGFFITAILWFAHSRGKEFDYFNNFLFKNVSRQQIGQYWTLIEESSYQTLICTFLVSLVQAGILGAAALIIGISAWPIIFLVAFIFSFFPIVGTLPAAIIGLFLAYTQVGTTAFAIFLVAAGITSVADNFLRTWLISAQESVTPGSFNFFAIIGGIALLGFSGVLIGPFILAFATSLLKNNDD